MSLYLNFEPHSHYMGFAIKDNRESVWAKEGKEDQYEGYIENGNTYGVDTVGGHTLAEIRHNIKAYHLKKRDGYGERIAARRLNYLREELRGERISYEELAELQTLVPFIASDDVELLQAAGVPE